MYMNYSFLNITAAPKDRVTRVNLQRRFSAQYRIVENRSPCNMSPGTIFCTTLGSRNMLRVFELVSKTRNTTRNIVALKIVVAS